MKTIYLLGLLCISFFANSQQRDIDWSADLDYIKVELPKNHVNLYSQKGADFFLKGIEQISLENEQLTDLAVAIKLQQLISSLGDSHTMIGWKKFLDANKILPLNLMWFSDGIYILHTTKENESILGHKIIKINEIPIQTIIDSLSTILVVDNNAVIKKEIPRLMPMVQLYEYFFQINPDQIELQLQNPQGETISYTIKAALFTGQNMVACQLDSIALCYKDEKLFFIDYPLPKDNLYYIKYNTCSSREAPPQGFKGDTTKLPSFNEFKHKVIETINTNNFDKIVFDLRFNTGGDSRLGTDLVNQLALIDKVNQKGKLFIVIGRQTFSSAIINVMDFKDKTQAILVGEETWGKPNHFGEIKLMKLPSSGLPVQYSTKYFKRTKLDMKTITPDYTIESSFKDYKEGHDPVYDWIIEQ